MIQCVNHDRFGLTLVMLAIESGEIVQVFSYDAWSIENCYHNIKLKC